MSANLTSRPRPGEDLPQALVRITRAPLFTNLVVLAILAAGIASGLETYPSFRDGAIGTSLNWLQESILVLFMVEIMLRIGSYGLRPWRFFQSGWNLFDFAIVVLCLLPLHSEYVIVLRLLRILRLFTALHGLQVVVTGLLKGIPSLGYVGQLLLVHFYIYAVIGTFAFGDNDPIRFGSLHRSMLTLFQVLTLEGWNDILSTQLLGSDVGYDDAWKQLADGRVSVARPVAATAFFISFILIGTMIILNVVTGVIIRSMEEASVEVAAERQKRHALARGELPSDELKRLGTELEDLASRIAVLSQSMAQAPQDHA